MVSMAAHKNEDKYDTTDNVAHQPTTSTAAAAAAAATPPFTKATWTFSSPSVATTEAIKRNCPKTRIPQKDIQDALRNVLQDTIERTVTLQEQLMELERKGWHASM
jgi:hypothetical protein